MVEHKSMLHFPNVSHPICCGEFQSVVVLKGGEKVNTLHFTVKLSSISKYSYSLSIQWKFFLFYVSHHKMMSSTVTCFLLVV